jgi:outer membrane lipoprotein-sorting protein
MMCAIRAEARIRLTVGVLFLIAAPATAQSVDEIIAKTLAARGGVEKLRRIETVKSSGKMSARGGELQITTWIKRPNKMRRETVFPDRSFVVAFDGSTVWAMDGAEGKPQVMTGPQADATRDQIALDPVYLDYKAHGHRIELVGTETIDGVRAHKLRVTKRNGQVAYHFISADTGVELRTVDTFDQGGLKVEVRTDLSDYRTVDGMLVPYSIKQFSNGNLAAHFTLEKVEFNTPMDDELFRMK